MMGAASFSRYAEMLSRPVALSADICLIKVKTSWHKTSIEVKVLSDGVK